MPYKSDAQRRFFHAAEARGDIKPSTVKEFDAASKGKKLPEKKHMSNEKKTYGDMDLDGATGDVHVIDDKGKHKMHGADGSHQNSHKEHMSGARKAIHTGHPDELEKYHEKDGEE
jgi:hypothetical protein